VKCGSLRYKTKVLTDEVAVVMSLWKIRPGKYTASDKPLDP